MLAVIGITAGKSVGGFSPYGTWHHTDYNVPDFPNYDLGVSVPYPFYCGKRDNVYNSDGVGGYYLYDNSNFTSYDYGIKLADNNDFSLIEETRIDVHNGLYDGNGNPIYENTYSQRLGGQEVFSDGNYSYFVTDNPPQYLTGEVKLIDMSTNMQYFEGIVSMANQFGTGRFKYLAWDGNGGTGLEGGWQGSYTPINTLIFEYSEDNIIFIYEYDAGNHSFSTGKEDVYTYYANGTGSYINPRTHTTIGSYAPPGQEIVRLDDTTRWKVFVWNGNGGYEITYWDYYGTQISFDYFSPEYLTLQVGIQNSNSYTTINVGGTYSSVFADGNGGEYYETTSLNYLYIYGDSFDASLYYGDGNTGDGINYFSDGYWGYYTEYFTS